MHATHSAVQETHKYISKKKLLEVLSHRYIQIAKGAEKTGPMVNKKQFRKNNIYRLHFSSKLELL